MTRKRIAWLAIFATVVLLIVLKYLHVGVIHYNWFLSILLAWTAMLIVVFKKLETPKHFQKQRSENGGG